MNKKYISLLAIIGVLASFALVSSVSAQAQPGPGGRGGMMGRAPGVFGTVSAINGDSLTVTSKVFARPGSTTTQTPTTYTVDATNATVTKNNAASSVSAIAVGDTIMAQGTLTGTNLVATKIRDGVPQGMMGQKGKGATPVITGNGQPIVAGKVTAVSGNTISITNNSNVSYTVDATNATIAVKNIKSTISSVSVGDNVIVQGTVNGNSVTASLVSDRGATPATNSGSPAKPAGFLGGMMQGIKNFFHIFGF